MPSDADEPAAQLRIGRWLPAVGPEQGREEDSPTVALPVLPDAADTAPERSPTDHIVPPRPPVPGAVSELGTPGHQGVPDDLDQPAQHAHPGEPGHQRVPDELDQPGEPGDRPIQDDLDQPAHPGEPGHHRTPDDHDQPAQPGHPGELGAPVAPAPRRMRHLPVVAAATLALAAMAAVGTVVALQQEPSASGHDVAAPPPTLSTGVAIPTEATGVSPSGTPEATVTPTPSATTPSPTTAPSSGSPSTTPGVPGAGLDVSMEAEASSTVLGGRTRIEARAGASGGYVVGRIGGGAVHYVRFAPITADVAGTYTLTIRYFSDATRRAVISVNGATVASVSCPGRAGAGSVSVRIPLAAGRNTIEYGNDDAAAPDLDRITVVS